MTAEECLVALRDAIILTTEQDNWGVFIVGVCNFFIAEFAELEKQLSIETSEGVWLDKIAEQIGISRTTSETATIKELQDDELFRSVVKLYADNLWNGTPLRTMIKLAELLGMKGKMRVFINQQYMTIAFFNLTNDEMAFIERIVPLLKLFKNNYHLMVTTSPATSMILNESWGKLGKIVYKDEN